MTFKFHRPKFFPGDLVHINKDLGPTMSHFTNDSDAIVEEISECQNDYQYGLYIKNEGYTSWYYESQLTLIKRNCYELLLDWKEEQYVKDKLHSDLDWIFENGKEVLNKGYSASLTALGKNFGMDSLWGNNGEGITYFTRSMQVMEFTKPFLETGDKKGFLKLCQGIKPKETKIIYKYKKPND